MFGYLSPIARRGKLLAEHLDSDRLKFQAELTSVGAAGNRLDPVLRSFQWYCMHATAVERSYGRDQIAILDAAMDRLLRQGDKEKIGEMEACWWTQFETDQAACREFQISHMILNFASMSESSQDRLRDWMNTFHQSTRMSIGGAVRDPELLCQALLDSPKIILTPEQTAMMEGGKPGQELQLTREQLEGLKPWKNRRPS